MYALQDATAAAFEQLAQDLKQNIKKA